MDEMVGIANRTIPIAHQEPKSTRHDGAQNNFNAPVTIIQSVCPHTSTAMPQTQLPRRQDVAEAMRNLPSVGDAPRNPAL